MPIISAAANAKQEQSVLVSQVEEKVDQDAVATVLSPATTCDLADIDGLSNVVTTVHYVLRTTTRGIGAAQVGDFVCGPPDPDNFVEAADTPEFLAVVESWLPDDLKSQAEVDNLDAIQSDPAFDPAPSPAAVLVFSVESDS